MIRYLVVAVWSIAVALGSVYAGTKWASSESGSQLEDSPLAGLDYVKTQPISVPVIRDEKVTGYVLAQFVYTVDAQIKSGLKVPLDAFLLDEAFRHIYAAEKINFEKLKRYDLNEMTEEIRTTVNARFKSKLLHDVLIEQLNFITMDMIREKLARVPPSKP